MEDSNKLWRNHMMRTCAGNGAAFVAAGRDFEVGAGFSGACTCHGSRRRVARNEHGFSRADALTRSCLASAQRVTLLADDLVVHPVLREEREAREERVVSCSRHRKMETATGNTWLMTLHNSKQEMSQCVLLTCFRRRRWRWGFWWKKWVCRCERWLLRWWLALVLHRLRSHPLHKSHESLQPRNRMQLITSVNTSATNTNTRRAGKCTGNILEVDCDRSVCWSILVINGERFYFNFWVTKK